MNMPPECEFKEDSPTQCKHTLGPAKFDHLWSVLNKTQGKQFIVCAGHLALVLEPGATLVLCPAKDYSKKKDEENPSKQDSQTK